MPLPLPPADLHAHLDETRLPPLAGVLIAMAMSAALWAVILAFLLWRA
jgi:hypothetical protein